MKYNEKNLTDLFKNEKDIWDTDDLDWLDSQLVHKLQNGELPAEEKSTLIEMMANDQAVMNRYLQLKQHTMPIKESLSENIFGALYAQKMIPLLATGLALVIALVVIFKQQDNIEFDTNIVRGIPNASIYPIANSLLDNPPEYFIVNNKTTEQLQLQLKFNETILWVSDLQQSNKFYLPIQVKQQLKPGIYSWSVKNNQGKIVTTNNFTIN